MRNLVLLFCLLVVATAAFAQTSYKYGDETPFPVGNPFLRDVVNAGIAVDWEGKVWIQTYGSTSDTLAVGPPLVRTGSIYVYNPNGTQASFSPITILTGVTETGAPVTDTLNGSGYGLSLDPSDGNILSVKWSYRLWKIDYKTGQGIRRVQSPGTFGPNSFAGAAANDLGEVYLTRVIGPFLGMILNPDFTVATTNFADAVPNIGRAIAVTKDGNDVYVPRFTGFKTMVYHSDNGSLGPYVQSDSLLLGGSVESIAIHPVTGHVWMSTDRRSTRGAVSGGSLDTIAYTPNTYYAWDPVSKALVDSFNVSSWSPLPTGPLPRGIAFSPTGDTVYVGHFDVPTLPSVVRFTKVIVGVERIEDAVPSGYELGQNYPNPFNPSTEIRFSVGNAGFVSLKVFDVLGREVETLVNEDLAAGVYTARFNASSFSTGTYVYVLTAGDVRISKKMLLTK